MRRQEPITLLICALGGEGGGVLTEWLVDTARRPGSGFRLKTGRFPPSWARGTGNTSR